MALSGCGEDAVRPEDIDTGVFDRQVRENSEAVAAAADSFYSANSRYPRHDGELVPFLPGGERLVNPATGEATDPVSPYDSDVLLDPPLIGSTGYRVIRAYDDQWRMVDLGYFIVGRGEHCDIVITNVPEADLQRGRDEAVVNNSRLVASAAYAFAQENDGAFAWNNGDVNNSGLRVQDYLPEGKLLMNPYTELNTEPQWGTSAAGAGAVGYVARDLNGDNIIDGFGVTGVGSEAGTTLIALGYPPEDGEVPPPEVVITPCTEPGERPPPLPGFDEVVRANCDAVEAAAIAFHGVYGQYALNHLALLPYFPNSRWLFNPATYVEMEPSGRVPKHPGSIGYRLIAEYRVGVVGYYVEGLGREVVFRRTNLPDVERHLALERAVVANCHVVEQAADSFAADNGGVYPAARYEISRAGLSFQEYLPGGELLENPYTSLRTEPQWGEVARTAGEVGYVPFDDDRDGQTDGYGIAGVGAQEWGLVYSATWQSEPVADNRTIEEHMRDNLVIIGGAARVQYDIFGVYPADPAQLQQHLPAGSLLENPVTGEFTEPSGAIPDGSGSIGYRLIYEYGGGPVGYYTQGRWGQRYFDLTNIPDIERHLALESKVVLNCISVADAADAFAGENSGVYPSDANDVNNAGKTVLDYLSGGPALENPYTQQRSEPVWGLAATAPGQTGYFPWHDNGDRVPDGYQVSGVGAGPGVEIFVLLDRERRWEPPVNGVPVRISGGQ